MNTNIKFHIVSDKTISARYIKKNILKKIANNNLAKSNCIIVIGGDGFMLKTLIKFYKFKKPFYGLNSGSYGFLMNKFFRRNFIKKLKKIHSITINPLEMLVKKKNNQVKKSISPK